jgi:putative toxin-antitoxin system antitoxin component (TIGR02293 family)
VVVPVESVARILGGRAILKVDVRTLGDLERAVARGLPVQSLTRTATYIARDSREVTSLKDRLVPPATRKRRKSRLKPAESERVERLARVMALAEQVWESHEAAREWMARPHALLGDRSPLDVAQTELGAREVEQLLWKLEYSLPV